MIRCKLFLCSGPCLVLAICVLVGCGGGNHSPVSGKVMNGDKPLTTGSVTFHPDAAKGNKSTLIPSAEIGEDGTYTLYADEKEGAPAGWYKVTVFAEEKRAEEGEDAYATPKFLVGEQYTSEQGTPLSIEVKDDAPAGHYNIKLESPK